MESLIDFVLPSGPSPIDKRWDPVTNEDRNAGREKPPYFLNPFVVANAGINLSYFVVGFSFYFLQAPVSVYLVTILNISATQFSAYSALLNIPWSLKIFGGMISDGVPLYGYRRKSWMTIFWVGFIAVLFGLAFTPNPGVNLTMALMFLQALLSLFADVCTDSLVVDRSRYENEKEKGLLLTSGYTIRAYGTVIGAVLGAVLYNIETFGWGLTINQTFLLAAILPLVLLVPFLVPLEELYSGTHFIPNFTDQMHTILKVMELKAVYEPTTFLIIYGIFQIPNPAWTNFLLIGLHFTDFEYGMLTVASCVLSYVGMLVYSFCFFDTSWRWIYIYTTVLAALFSLLQILLILRLNVVMGIPDFWFAIGDTAVMYFVWSVQYMPGSILFAMVAPEGYEGMTYALLTTIWNLSYGLATDISSAMTLIWDVSNETLAKGDFSGVLYLAILTSLLQVVPLCLVWMLPDTKRETGLLVEKGERNAAYGGWLLAAVALGLLGSVVVTIVLIWFGPSSR